MSYFLQILSDDGKPGSAQAKFYSNIQDEALLNACNRVGFKDEIGEYLAVHLDDASVLVIGGADSISSTGDAETIGGKLYKHLTKKPFDNVMLDLSSLSDINAAHLLHGARLASYSFQSYFTKGDKKTSSTVYASGLNAAATEIYETLERLADGVKLARDVLYEPANTLYPESYAERCKPLAALGLEIDVLDEAQMESLGMGALLGVGQGSVRESRIVVMNWKGGADEAPLALVGKGVCFDTGGISLKPPKGMEDMKWDMGGSAAVVGAMCAIAGRKVARNVVGIIGLVENMPDGNAQRPGDVVTSMSGQTIEVINTDAEGRLVLADVLTYVQQTYKPQAIVDLATLTGAILVALGKEYAGLFSNSDGLVEQLQTASQNTGEKMWRMPVGDYYDKQLKSHIADMKNIGTPYGGSCSAAAFLERFIENETPWAHLDIAGKAWSDSGDAITPAGGTGYGVRLLTKFVEDWHDINGTK